MNQSPKDLWRTPVEVFRWAALKVGGSFELDAACNSVNNLARPLWTLPGFKSGDSLSAPWPDNRRIWCNPPYSRGHMDPFIDAALACKSIVAMLIMSPNGEDRFEFLAPRSHEIHIVGRIAFLDGSGRPAAGNNRGSSLFLINPPFGAGQRSIVTRDEIYGRKAA